MSLLNVVKKKKNLKNHRVAVEFSSDNKGNLREPKLETALKKDT